MKILPKKFYQNDPALVAERLLGKVLVRRLDDKVLSGLIVETEAYYGEDDPASRAYKGKKKFARLMWEDVGKAFIYMVHGNWLFNIIAHPENAVGGVLIRAIRPLDGIEEMKRNRKVKNLVELTNGPGKLTKAMEITKELNGTDLTSYRSNICICESKRIKPFTVLSSHRIGVTRDLPKNLRFYIKGNVFVSS